VGFGPQVSFGAFAEAGVFAAEGSGGMARARDHAHDNFFVNALVPFEGNDVAERQHQLEFESHHVVQAGISRGQDFVDDAGDIFGGEFVIGKQAIDDGLVLAEPEIIDVAPSGSLSTAVL
jgi:hypothetical protein